jgi:hypothetical protein
MSAALCECYRASLMPFAYLLLSILFLFFLRPACLTTHIDFAPNSSILQSGKWDCMDYTATCSIRCGHRLRFSHAEFCIITSQINFVPDVPPMPLFRRLPVFGRKPARGNKRGVSLEALPLTSELPLLALRPIIYLPRGAMAVVAAVPTVHVAHPRGGSCLDLLFCSLSIT